MEIPWGKGVKSAEAPRCVVEICHEDIIEATTIGWIFLYRVTLRTLLYLKKIVPPPTSSLKCVGLPNPEFGDAGCYCSLLAICSCLLAKVANLCEFLKSCKDALCF